MLFTDDFFLDVSKIGLAHEYILDRVHRCEYSHDRGHYGLVYVLSGRAEYRFYGGERVTVCDGNTLFLSPYAAYSIVTEKEFKHYTVNFDIHEDTSRLGALDQPYYLLQEESTEQIKRCFIRLTDIWKLKKTGFEMRANSCLYELLSAFYYDFINRKHTASYERMLPVKEYIEQHFDRSITLDELAKYANMSITNFRREWKKQYTESPLQYRDSIRLHYAKEYLSSGYYTVSEVASKCGFDDASYFVRFFKKQTGLTPGVYQQRSVFGVDV